MRLPAVSALAMLGLLTGTTALSATPAEAGATPTSGTGYVLNADGSFYSLDTTSMNVQKIGTAQAGGWAIAAANDGQLYELAGETTQSLYRVDRSTGSASLVGALDAAQPTGSYYGALGTPSNGRLYTEEYLSEAVLPNQFASVSRSSGGATAVGAANDAELVALAGGCGGRLYGIDARNDLVKVDVTNGTAKAVGPLSASSLEAGEVATSLAVDHRSGAMFALTAKTSGAKRLWRVNPGTGAMTVTSYVDGQQGASPVSIAIDSPAGCQYTRKLTLSYSKLHSRFQGTLSSPFAACAARKPVVVYRKRSGPDAKVGATTTGSAGGFRLPKAFHHGSYYAVAPRASAAGICLRTVSGTHSY